MLLWMLYFLILRKSPARVMEQTDESESKMSPVYLGII